MLFIFVLERQIFYDRKILNIGTLRRKCSPTLDQIVENGLLQCDGEPITPLGIYSDRFFSQFSLRKIECPINGKISTSPMRVD